MKKVVIRPERCVGCMQCMITCATTHSRSLTLYKAVCEKPLPRPRVHVGAGLFGEGFPNRCRHCDPAPCMAACLPGAIFRDLKTESVLINPNRCINCASCAMACPFGVIRYHKDASALHNQSIAVKCDNCIDRQNLKAIPACVETCKTGALVFEEPDVVMRQKTSEVAASMSKETGLKDTRLRNARLDTGLDTGKPGLPPGLSLLNDYKRALSDLNQSETIPGGK